MEARGEQKQLASVPPAPGTGDPEAPDGRTRGRPGRSGHIPLWRWWIVVVWIVSLPWTGVTQQPQWSRVHWLPFTDPADDPRDLIANIALFVPFGYSLNGGRRGYLRTAAALLAAAAISISAEATQLFSTVRYPSATDVGAAVAGAAVGIAWRLQQQKQPNPGS
jgi:hypothetical protein